MLSRNNREFRQRQLTNKQPRFTLVKLSIGLVSALTGMYLMGGVVNADSTASADSQNTVQNQPSTQLTETGQTQTQQIDHQVTAPTGDNVQGAQQTGSPSTKVQPATQPTGSTTYQINHGNQVNHGNQAPVDASQITASEDLPTIAISQRPAASMFSLPRLATMIHHLAIHR